MTSEPIRHSLMDELLRGGIPQIKLGLGDAIDRENARPLPPRYARLLPETLLVVTLRPDAADALEPIASDLERELTDSCTRHGSLYDRSYRVRLQRSSDRDAPLYVIGAHAGKDIGGPGAATPEPERVARQSSSGDVPLPPRDEAAAPPPGDREVSGGLRGTSPTGTATTAPALPIAESDVTRIAPGHQ